ncbi:hypothetical protein FRC11_010016 [Ceratobasidium sp. 423]|nr:hypothetical protein FRC11_010016 [Ceratobasidium sp. 423]
MFIERLTGGTELQFEGQDPYTMLRLIPLSVDTRTQDFIPKVMRLIIEFYWHKFLNWDSSVQEGAFIKSIFIGIHDLICPTHNEPYQLASPTQMGILNVMHATSVLDLVARVIVHLEPDGNESSSTFSAL